VKTGTTLVVDWESKRIRARLQPLDLEARRFARDAKIRDWASQGIIRLVPAPVGARAPGSLPFAYEPSIAAQTDGGALRLRGTLQALHLVPERADA